LPIYGDMAAELEMAIAQGSPKCPYLVQDEGKSVFDFKKAWKAACKAAGVPNALSSMIVVGPPYAIMIDSGLSESEAMEITGHKTRSMFERYHIRSDRRLKQNAAKMEAHVQTLAAEAQPSDEQVH